MFGKRYEELEKMIEEMKKEEKEINKKNHGLTSWTETNLRQKRRQLENEKFEIVNKFLGL